MLLFGRFSAPHQHQHHHCSRRRRCRLCRRYLRRTSRGREQRDAPYESHHSFMQTMALSQLKTPPTTITKLFIKLLTIKHFNKITAEQQTMANYMDFE